MGDFSQKQEISYPTKSPSNVTSGSVPTGTMFAQTVPSTMHNSDQSPDPIGPDRAEGWPCIGGHYRFLM
jgi:hypothetical protein